MVDWDPSQHGDRCPDTAPDCSFGTTLTRIITVIGVAGTLSRCRRCTSARIRSRCQPVIWALCLHAFPRATDCFPHLGHVAVGCAVLGCHRVGGAHRLPQGRSGPTPRRGRNRLISLGQRTTTSASDCNWCPALCSSYCPVCSVPLRCRHHSV